MRGRLFVDCYKVKVLFMMSFIGFIYRLRMFFRYINYFFVVVEYGSFIRVVSALYVF